MNRTRTRHIVMLAAAGLGLAHAIACSVDGVTPDCTDPNVCAPSLDSGSESSSIVSEAAPNEAATTLPEAGKDADTADADGG